MIGRFSLLLLVCRTLDRSRFSCCTFSLGGFRCAAVVLILLYVARASLADLERQLHPLGTVTYLDILSRHDAFLTSRIPYKPPLVILHVDNSQALALVDGQLIIALRHKVVQRGRGLSASATSRGSRLGNLRGLGTGTGSPSDVLRLRCSSGFILF